MGKSQDLYKKAKTIIPGGTQLLSKRPELFLPELWPAYYKKAKGCEIWDLDDKHYFDMVTMGIGCCTLGYADEDVNEAVKNAIENGSMSSLNSYEEVELGELICSIHPWADMIRCARTGGEAMTVAIRIARAASGKDRVLFCGYHGWHDWYLAANLRESNELDKHLLSGLEPNGVPSDLKGTAIGFKFNDIDEFTKLINSYNDTGVIVLETIRNEPPSKEFIEAISKTCKSKGIVFVVDEITCGFRLNIGGAHLLYDIEPDIAVYAKGISNGYPMSVVIGKMSVMEAAQKSFISSTYWTERIGPTAALATLKKMERLHVPEILIRNGKQVQNGWLKSAEKAGIEIETSGIFPLSHFNFVSKNSMLLKTIFTQEMLKRGYLASTIFYSSIAHNENIINEYLNHVVEVFHYIKTNIDNNQIADKLETSVCHSGFQRLN